MSRFIKTDKALLRRLSDWLCTESPESSELIAGLDDITEGRADSLTIGINDAPEDAASGDIVVGELRISPKSRRVTIGAREITLTPKEFDILCFLAENRGEVFTKEQIYRAVWSENYLLDDSNIMAFIRKLRKKIEPDPDAPKYIITIWGIGYKFNDMI